jgi:predicted NUDIX family NTP pyrophosphohydrolase
LTDNLFVEIHGDFWHCKPGTKYEIPKYEHQKNNLVMDAKKEEWCKKRGITLRL